MDPDRVHDWAVCFMENTNNNTLNLARKWRSKNFDQIIGQDLSLRMLKNSLYLGQYFPVYLFSGNRGCGKTTTARVFAAALNCEQLPVFQKNPKHAVVPCLECASCVAMAQGKHPDFFEIDAASHTGVDTIRTIIEAAQLLPLMGTKKIYLIDEAHMLSKASFNALLKILEEPPRSVLFILATTDEQKIIDTVRSRCFQLFFKHIESNTLLTHLMHICDQEKIIADTEGLLIIIRESEGCARDAINLLEQVRFAAGKVTKEAVLKVLGHLDDATLVTLFEHVLYKKPAQLLHFMQSHAIEQFSAESIWERLHELLRAALWIKHGVKPVHFVHQAALLEKLVTRCSWAILHEFFKALNTNDAVFARTTAKHALLEMILLQLCQKNKGNDDATGMPTLCGPSTAVAQEHESVDDEQEDNDEVEDEIPPAQEQDGISMAWNRFLVSIDTLQDPLLRSVFKQASVQSFDSASHRLDVAFSKDLTFFKDWIDESHAWQPLLRHAFSSEQIVLNATFTAASKAQPVVPVIPQMQPVYIEQEATQKREAQSVEQKKYSIPTPRGTSYSAQRSFQRPTAKPRMEPGFDVSNEQEWPQAHLLLRYFPGTVYEVKEVGS
jgi:DNA polymerase III subunit gamma/tau